VQKVFPLTLTASHNTFVTDDWRQTDRRQKSAEDALQHKCQKLQQHVYTTAVAPFPPLRS